MMRPRSTPIYTFPNTLDPLKPTNQNHKYKLLDAECKIEFTNERIITRVQFPTAFEVPFSNRLRNQQRVKEESLLFLD
jgi:hypothetical protein